MRSAIPHVKPGKSDSRRPNALPIGLALLAILFMCFGSAVAAKKAVRRATSAEAPKKAKTAKFGKLYALVVGISEYRSDRIPNLNLAARDAQDVARFLETQGELFEEVRLKVLLNEQATRQAVEKYLLYEMLKAGKDDSVVLYFSGHGAIDPKRGSEFFFVTYDADPEYLAATALLVSGVRFMKRLSARHALLLADMCHAGGISEWQTKSIVPSLESVVREFQESSGRVIITSSKPDEYSLEMPGMENSVFTHFLLKGLKGEADDDRDGLVSVRELYQFVYDRTKDITQGAQHPRFEGQVTGIFPLSLLHAGGPTLEITTDPPRVGIYLRDDHDFKFVKETDARGKLALRDLPIGEPVIVMARKPGLKDRILDPVVFSEESRRIETPAIRLEPALGFVLVKSNTPDAQVSLDGSVVGATGADGLYVVNDLQVGVPHSITLKKERYTTEEVKFTVPPEFEGKVYPLSTIVMAKGSGRRRQSAGVPTTDSTNGATDVRESSEPAGGVALIAAARSGNAAELNSQLDSGQAVNTRDRDGNTPLMAAARAGKTDAARMLLEYGADVNAAGLDGLTPLMSAAKNGDTALVRILLEAGARRSATDKTGWTAAQWAGSKGHEDLKALLTEGSAEAPEAYAEVIRTDRPEGCLRIRSGPSSSHEKIGCAEQGARLGLTGKRASGNWLEISTPIRGWVYGGQIRTPQPARVAETQPEPAASPAPQPREEKPATESSLPDVKRSDVKFSVPDMDGFDRNACIEECALTYLEMGAVRAYASCVQDCDRQFWSNFGK